MKKPPRAVVRAVCVGHSGVSGKEAWVPSACWRPPHPQAISEPRSANLWEPEGHRGSGSCWRHSLSRGIKTEAGGQLLWPPWPALCGEFHIQLNSARKMSRRSELPEPPSFRPVSFLAKGAHSPTCTACLSGKMEILKNNECSALIFCPNQSVTVTATVPGVNAAFAL